MKRTQTLPKWDVKFKKLNFWSDCSKFHKCGWSQCYSLSTPTCETCRIEQGCDTIPLTQNCKTVSRSFCFHCLIFSSFLCILFTTEGQRSQPVPLLLTSWGFPSSPADRGRQTAGRRRSRLLCSLWRETHSQWVETEESFFPFISPSAQH